VLSDLAARNISYVHAYCVDNCLVRVADPVFIGYSILKQADCAAKVVPKASPSESYENDLAFHIARKKIAHIDLESGSLVKPSKPNGMKLEMFVFDVFPYTKNFAVLEVARNEEFSPLKNAPGTGSDDPETSRRDLLAQHKRFLEGAGAFVKDGVEIELSPLVSYAGEGLSGVKGKTYAKSGIAEALEELDALA
ncbi:nucleotide-diphospho-sugar transferase, partial [Schizophyllum fasciatum]